MVCIGSGFAGLTLAYKVLHELQLEDTIDFTIYERQVHMSCSDCRPEGIHADDRRLLL